jgi:hypothetical protein
VLEPALRKLNTWSWYAALMRLNAALILLLLVSFGCTEQPMITESPDYGYQEPVYTPCVNVTECDAGEMCLGNICVPDPTGGTGPGTGTTGGTPWDSGVTPQPDAGTQPPQPDTKQPAPTTDDTCGLWLQAGGTYMQLGTYPACEIGHGCKIDPQTKAAACVKHTGAGDIGAACSDSAECDVFYGCYLGYCTNYCQLKYKGDEECNGTECMHIGHPVLGSCKGN